MTETKHADTPLVDSKGIPYDTRSGPKDRRKRHDRARKQDTRHAKTERYVGERKLPHPAGLGWVAQLLLGSDEVLRYYSIPDSKWKRCLRYKGKPEMYGRRTQGERRT